MCIVDSLSVEPNLLAGTGRTGKIAMYAVEKHRNFCKLGAVSPDCPFLDYFSASSKGWGNVMHYWGTSDIIRKGITFFAPINFETLETGDHDLLRALAWLFGYTAHVATDLTVHPVLEASGFGYAANPTIHRRCELHQDAYIFKQLQDVEETDIDYIINCGIATCGDPENKDRLHPAIRGLWEHCLADIHPVEVHMQNGASGPSSAPAPDAWFAEYAKRLHVYVAKGGGFPIFIRDLLEAKAVFLPKSGKVNQTYIRKLKTSTNQETDYDKVFASALANVRKTWEELAKALAANDQNVFAMKNANLDTGEADDASGQIFIT